MKIQFSPYTLIKKNKVNAADQSLEQKGSLLKVIDEKNNWGVADLCPWPSLGDLKLADEFKTKGVLYQRALQLAHEDLKARREKKSLLQDKWVMNNVLVSNYLHFDFKNERLKNKILKIKSDQNISELARILNAAPSSLKFRLDFNADLNTEQFHEFLSLLKVKSQVEYIEDPTNFDSKLWTQWNKIVPLATDFIKADGYYKIIKPAREQLPMGSPYTITSAMDHPVGVTHALRLAQQFAKSVSGLMTLDLYEPTEFHNYFLVQNETELNFSQEALHDFGIGMTKELNLLQWIDSL